MKATELMIGDWVMNTHNRKPEQVCEIMERLVMLDFNDLYDYDEIEPIPLTDAFLKANGFKRTGGASHWSKGDYFASIMHWNENKVELIIGSRQKDIMFRGYIHYVHDLQHAFAFCGIDKEFVLKAKPKKKKTAQEQHHSEESSVYDGPEGVWDNR